MNNEMVSIIIPVYNGSNYLKNAIESALAQTYTNKEIIVINDGSNDNGQTRNIAIQYSDKIRYYEKENGHVASALNYGIAKMKGTWFSWLSHDDLYCVDKISCQMKSLTKIEGKSIASLCSMDFIDEYGNPLFHPVIGLRGKLDGIKLYKQYLRGYHLNGLGFLVKKTDLISAGLFDTELRYTQDYDMWVRLMQNNVTFVCIKDKLTKTRIHKEQDTIKHANSLAIDQELYLDKLLQRIEQMDGEKRDAWRELLVYTYIKKGLYDVAEMYRKQNPIQSFATSRFKLNCYKYYLLSKTYGLIKNL